MVKNWKKQLLIPSGSLTTNASMPSFLIEKLLRSDKKIHSNFALEETQFPALKKPLSDIRGFSILAGLQKLSKLNHLTVFRAVRFPTKKRIHELVMHKGCAISNYEQSRILCIYNDPEYNRQRSCLKSNSLFWTQPQERVVSGLPVFALVNDAVQIHNAFRGSTDQVIIVVIHIPTSLIASRKVKFIANSAIDLDHSNSDRDFEIQSYIAENGIYKFDFNCALSWGVDLYEMYSRDLPWNLHASQKMRILQEFYLLDIYKIKDYSYMLKALSDRQILQDNQFFLHGFWGDQNIFGRRRSEYLPYRCRRILHLSKGSR